MIRNCGERAKTFLPNTQSSLVPSRNKWVIFEEEAPEEKVRPEAKLVAKEEKQEEYKSWKCAKRTHCKCYWRRSKLCKCSKWGKQIMNIAWISCTWLYHLYVQSVRARGLLWKPKNHFPQCWAPFTVSKLPMYWYTDHATELSQSLSINDLKGFKTPKWPVMLAVGLQIEETICCNT